jgi:hypothetical protein
MRSIRSISHSSWNFRSSSLLRASLCTSKGVPSFECALRCDSSTGSAETGLLQFLHELLGQLILHKGRIHRASRFVWERWAGSRSPPSLHNSGVCFAAKGAATSAPRSRRSLIVEDMAG